MSGITSIQGNQLFTGSTGRSFNVSTGSVAEAGKQTSAQGINQNETASKDGDTVEISAAGTVLSSTMSSQSSSSTSDLSSYSASQLKQMLENGEITQAEYEAEIQSRSTSTNESSDEA